MTSNFTRSSIHHDKLGSVKCDTWSNSESLPEEIMTSYAVTVRVTGLSGK
jgi:hypothetical protein